MSSPHGYRPDIDGLRALSILLVVAFHAGLAGFAGGFVGVDVFFVLSGYLITGLLVSEHARSGRISLRSFFARRLRRLLPMASIVIVVTVIAGFWLLPPVQRPALAGDAIAATFYVANWRFASQATAYSDFAVTDGLLLHYWSLSVEEQFYVLWPLLVVSAAWLARRRAAVGFVTVLRVVIAALVAVSFLLSVTVTESRGTGAYYLTHTRLWELGAGALLAVWLPNLRALADRTATVLGVLGLAAIGVAATSYDATTAFPGYAALLPVLGAIAVIVAGRAGTNPLARGLGIAPLATLGRWSYAWYLWHWPAIGIALLYNERVGAPWPDNTVIAIAVFASLGLAWASHVLIETPLRTAAWLQVDRRSLAFGLGLSLVPVITVVTLTNTSDTGDRAVALPVATDSADGRATGPTSSVGASAGTSAFEPQVAPGPAGTPMSPAEAADDITLLGWEACNSSLTGSIELDESCVAGDPNGAITVALVGDSHAQHWLPTLDVIGQARGWRVLSWTKSGCPAVDVPVWLDNQSAPYDDCADWYDGVLERLAAEPQVDVVVLSRSYGYRNLILDDEGGRYIAPGETLPPDALDQWRTGMERTFDSYRAVADRIVGFRETPWARTDVPACLSAALSNPEECAIDFDGAVGRDATLHGVEAEVAPDTVEYVDFTAVVCPQDPCSMVTEGGTIKYRDRHHFTRTFALQLAPLVEQGLAALVEPPVSGDARD